MWALPCFMWVNFVPCAKNMQGEYSQMGLLCCDGYVVPEQEKEKFCWLL